ncbi:MAG: glucuronate isomerase [Candidatus Aminicenantales bacterium]
MKGESEADVFIHEDFLLDTEEAKTLYHAFAENLPIIDFHSHLSPKDIAENRRFDNLTRIWLDGDHYKWRALRAAGVDERFITGDANDCQKFEKWAETVPKTLGNPLYHWTHLELKRMFGIDRLLNPSAAKNVWEECKAKLAKDDFTVQGILRRMNVEAVCTTDDPVDDLRYHEMLKNAKGFPVSVYPAFRPDKAMAIEDPKAFSTYIGALAQAAGMDVHSYNSFLQALRRRHDHFHSLGCRVSDHGLETIFAEDYTDAEVRGAFAAALAGNTLAPQVILQFKSAMLYEFAVMDWEKGWAQQFHLGALRNANTRLTQTLGPDSGFDSIGDFELARPLAKFLDRLDAENKLAKTILYNLNPRDNEVVASMTGNFQDGACPGRMQFGPAWWFLDQIDGMTKQIRALSNMGLLSQFVGMTTDSRSFLSFPRHEYLRRLLCRILGGDMKRGLLPHDLDLVGGLVRDVCYSNAKRYFGFPELGR